MDPLQDFISSLNRLHNEQMELAAIWMQTPVLTARGRTARIAPGELVKIEGGKIVDAIDGPTHKVIGCIGTLYNKFELTLLDLETNQPLQINI